jgi:DNA-binding protein
MEAIDKKDAVDIFANVPSCSEVTVRRMSKRKREETAEQSNQFYVRKGTFRKTMIKRIINFLIPSFKKQGRERLTISDLETAYRTGNSVLPSSLDRKRDYDSSEYDHVIVHGLGLAAHEAVLIALELKTKYPQEVSIGNITTSTENMHDTVENIQNGERSDTSRSVSCIHIRINRI